MSDLYTERKKLESVLKRALNEVTKRGIEKAESERKYRMALHQGFLKEKANGMAASAIYDYIRGDEEIADLCFERDVAETKYKAALEAVNVYKIFVKIKQEDLEREYRG